MQMSKLQSENMLLQTKIATQGETREKDARIEDLLRVCKVMRRVACGNAELPNITRDLMGEALDDCASIYGIDLK